MYSSHPLSTLIPSLPRALNPLSWLNSPLFQMTGLQASFDVLKRIWKRRRTPTQLVYICDQEDQAAINSLSRSRLFPMWLMFSFPLMFLSISWAQKNDFGSARVWHLDRSVYPRTYEFCYELFSSWFMGIAFWNMPQTCLLFVSDRLFASGKLEDDFAFCVILLWFFWICWLCILMFMASALYMSFKDTVEVSLLSAKESQEREE